MGLRCIPLVLTLLLLSISSLESLPVKTRVVIKCLSDMPIQVHCKSADDDLGVHQLVPQQQYSWHFKPNIFGTTHFDCDIQSAYGSGFYNVYDDNKDHVCSPTCVWEISNKGVCLLTLRPGTVFCEDWRNKKKLH